MCRSSAGSSFGLDPVEKNPNATGQRPLPPSRCDLCQDDPPSQTEELGFSLLIPFFFHPHLPDVGLPPVHGGTYGIPFHTSLPGPSITNERPPEGRGSGTALPLPAWCRSLSPPASRAWRRHHNCHSRPGNTGTHPNPTLHLSWKQHWPHSAMVNRLGLIPSRMSS